VDVAIHLCSINRFNHLKLGKKKWLTGIRMSFLWGLLLSSSKIKKRLFMIDLHRLHQIRGFTLVMVVMVHALSDVSVSMSSEFLSMRSFGAAIHVTDHCALCWHSKQVFFCVEWTQFIN
jgi:hypothetical protein